MIISPTLEPPVSDKDHVAGPAHAPVILLEFGDFECPHCRRASPIVKAVQKAMNNHMRFAFRHFPLSKTHPHAQHAAEIAEAAATKGKFWQMHDILFQNQESLEDDDLISYADSLGIDPDWAAQVLHEGTFRQKVRSDFMSGIRSGANGTPTFFINGVRHDANWDATSLLAAVMQAAVAGRT